MMPAEISMILIFIGIPLAYLLAAVAATIVVVKRVKTLPRKLAAGLLTLLFFIAIPTLDEILAPIVLQHLCETRSAVTVYKRIDLPARFWNKEYGMPDTRTIWDENRHQTLEAIGECCYRTRKLTTYSGLLGISEYVVEIRELATDDLLSKHSIFGFDGGWVSRRVFGSGDRKSCVAPDGNSENMYIQTFRQTQ